MAKVKRTKLWLDTLLSKADGRLPAKSGETSIKPIDWTDLKPEVLEGFDPAWKARICAEMTHVLETTLQSRPTYGYERRRRG